MNNQIDDITFHLTITSTNGSLPCVPLSPKMSHKYILKKQVKPTGVSLIVKNPVVSIVYET